MALAAFHFSDGKSFDGETLAFIVVAMKNSVSTDTMHTSQTIPIYIMAIGVTCCIMSSI